MSLENTDLLGLAAKLTRQREAATVPLELMGERARSAEYWRALVPDLSVEAAPGGEPAGGLGPAGELEAAATDVKTRGYFHVEQALSPEMTAAMRRSVETLVASGWPAVFSFVYDEFWSIVRTGAVASFLRRVLGDDCVQLEGIWTHYIRPMRGSHGWLPHVDSTGHRGGPEGLGVWFALSDATLDNGCMYVIPKDFAPERIARELSTIETFSAAEMKRLLQSARALPAGAGAMMGWEFNVIHWGSTSHGAAAPRVSTAMEFASREQGAAQPDNRQVSLRGSLPGLAERLWFIGRALRSYTRFEPMLETYEPLAKQLMKGL